MVVEKLLAVGCCFPPLLCINAKARGAGNSRAAPRVNALQAKGSDGIIQAKVCGLFLESLLDRPPSPSTKRICLNNLL
jgi:hypothetical protein